MSNDNINYVTINNIRNNIFIKCNTKFVRVTFESLLFTNVQLVQVNMLIANSHKRLKINFFAPFNGTDSFSLTGRQITYHLSFDRTCFVSVSRQRVAIIFKRNNDMFLNSVTKHRIFVRSPATCFKSNNFFSSSVHQHAKYNTSDKRNNLIKTKNKKGFIEIGQLNSICIQKRTVRHKYLSKAQGV